MNTRRRRGDTGKQRKIAADRRRKTQMNSEIPEMLLRGVHHIPLICAHLRNQRQKVFVSSAPPCLRGELLVLCRVLKEMNINSLTIESTRSAIAEKQITASSLVEEFYKKIKAEDGDIHAYLTLCEDRALQQQRALTSSREGRSPASAGWRADGIKDVMVDQGPPQHSWVKSSGKFHSAL